MGDADRTRGVGWPWGLVGMLALVLVAERYLDRNSARFLTTNELDWQTAGRDAARDATSAEVLCFGDSMLKFGVAPRLIEQRLGRSAYSLAILDGKPPASYFLLRRAIEAGARPRAVLVDFQPECMLEPPDHLLRNRHWKMLVSPRECWDLLLTFRDPVFFARTMLGRLLPSVRSRDAIRIEVVDALGGGGGGHAWENAKRMRNRRVNGGGMLLARKPSYRGDPFPKAPNDVSDPDWFNQAEQSSYVVRFMRLAGEHGIPVVWVLPPNAPRTEELRRRSGQFDRYTRFVRDVQSGHPGVHVIDGRLAGFDHTLFVDAVHLDRAGAEALSLGVAEILRSLLDGPTPTNLWAALPRIPPAEPAARLEDVDQSAVAIATAGGPTRR